MDRQHGHLTKNIDNIAASLIWIKVVGLGDTAVGKTCLIKHFCESKFSTGYQPTVGVDYGFKIQHIRNNDLRVHLWDLSGNSEYLDVRNELYAGTDAAFLVYDVTNPKSFENLDGWLKELSKYSSTSPVVCLVANKVDQRGKRMVSMADGQKWATAHKMNYYETSCTTGEGTEKMFNALLDSVAEKKNIGKREI